MSFTSVNFLIILVAAIAGWLVGAAWYGVLGRSWIAAQGKTIEQCRQENAGKSQFVLAIPFVVAFIANLIMAFVLSGVIGHIGVYTLRAGSSPARLCGSASSPRR